MPWKSCYPSPLRLLVTLAPVNAQYVTTAWLYAWQAEFINHCLTSTRLGIPDDEDVISFSQRFTKCFQKRFVV